MNRLTTSACLQKVLKLMQTSEIQYFSKRYDTVWPLLSQFHSEQLKDFKLTFSVPMFSILKFHSK